MNNVVDWPAKGNHPPSDNDNAAAEHLCRYLALAEAERSAWLAFRICRRTFHRTRSLTDEIVMLEARNAWDRAFRQAELEVAA